MGSKPDYKIGVIDFETDPFKYGRKVKPFACEIMLTEDNYVQLWGDDCAEQAAKYILELEGNYILFAHNGGRFDLFLGRPCLLHYCDRKIKIINGRIVQAEIGRHLLRDSFAIFPEALASFKGKHSKQIDFDYAKMEWDVREKNRQEILDYLHDDCLTLHEHCTGFFAEFGDNLTIGSTAMKELRKRHDFESFSGFDAESRDTEYRTFFYGGRTQCFKAGVIQGSYKIFDVNGMYQHVMRTVKHPISQHFTVGTKIGPRTNFAIVEARNYGALPTRTRQGIDYSIESGIFRTTIHEIEAGLETGTLEIIKVLETRNCNESATFDTFIDWFYNRRLLMKDEGDLMRDSFYKRIMNAAYGKFAQNPEDYMDYCILPRGEYPDNEEQFDAWHEHSQNGAWIIWEKPSQRKQYLNVATAASITGAARAILLRGLSSVSDPVYCDTDSIICLDGSSLDIDASRLGAWKLEGKKHPITGNVIYEADSVAIAGKKLYSVFGSDEGAEFGMKYACKGVRLSAKDIRRIAQGEMITFDNPAPSFGLSGEQRFVSRKVRATGKAGTLGQVIEFVQ